MGFYAQPEESQVDLLAYHRILSTRDEALRVGLLHPATLHDQITMDLLRKGKVRMVSDGASFLPAPTKMGDGHYQLPGPKTLPVRVVKQRMVAQGVSETAADWLFDPEA